MGISLEYKYHYASITVGGQESVFILDDFIDFTPCHG